MASLVRKNEMKEIEHTVVHIKNWSEHHDLMTIYQNNGWKYINGYKPHDSSFYKGHPFIEIKNFFDSLSHYKIKKYKPTILTFEEFRESLKAPTKKVVVAKEDKSKQIILLSKKHIMALRHKLLRKENPIWVELRENIEEQANFCLHCGENK